QVVEVVDNVTAGIIAPDTLCDGNAFAFQDNSTITIGIITGYEWDFGDGNTSLLQDPFHTYAAPGTYTVTHTVYASGGCSHTISTDVVVLDVPSALFLDLQACQNNPTTFTDLSSIVNGNIMSWTWDFGDGSPVSNDQNPTHIYTADGNFNVTL